MAFGNHYQASHFRIVRENAYSSPALKRIDQLRPKPRDVAVVARHQRQIVRQRGCCEEAIDDRDGPDGAHAAPLIGHGVVDAEHASIECGLDVPQPAFECRRLGRIPGAREFDTLSYFAKHERAQEDIRISD